ncbi:MAG0770 family lipoprotein [Mycoplasmopsis columbinasalis]|uniref:Lipoprotein n=1 Tax=Mycoplasmopsis columbinasalis TaxID=114880 RepID=A0A449B9N1_9BACT|nr:hypothetical protein [Mycoplasmopsis columbinasalis]VEU77864.1 Uncharacterised protein [Mycoplasmopsis columbinasalis]
MKSKWKWLTFTPVPLVLSTVSCSSSFYQLEQTLKVTFSIDFAKNVETYQHNYQQVTNFLSKDQNESAYKYLLKDWARVNEITNYWTQNISNQNKISLLLQQPFDAKDIGYYASDGTFVSLKTNLAWVLEAMDLNTNGFFSQDNFAAKIWNFGRLNREIDEVVQSALTTFERTAYGRFYRTLTIDPYLSQDWPFYHGDKEKTDILFTRLNTDAASFHTDFVAKIYDASKSGIDYSKLGNVLNPDGTYGHVHALVNLWREWTSMFVVYRDPQTGQIIINSNNKAQAITDFYQRFIAAKSALGLTSEKIVIINTQVQGQTFAFETFLDNWQTVINQNKGPELFVSNYITQFEDRLFKPLAEMNAIGATLVRSINEFGV